MSGHTVLPTFYTNAQSLFEYNAGHSSSAKINLFCLDIPKSTRTDSQVFLVRVIFIAIFKFMGVANNTERKGELFTARVPTEKFEEFNTYYRSQIIGVAGKKKLSAVEHLFSQLKDVQNRTPIFSLEKSNKHVTSFRIFAANKYEDISRDEFVNFKDVDKLELKEQSIYGENVIDVKIIKQKLFYGHSLCIVTNKNLVDFESLKELKRIESKKEDGVKHSHTLSKDVSNVSINKNKEKVKTEVTTKLDEITKSNSIESKTSKNESTILTKKQIVSENEELTNKKDSTTESISQHKDVKSDSDQPLKIENATTDSTTESISQHNQPTSDSNKSSKTDNTATYSTTESISQQKDVNNDSNKSSKTDNTTTDSTIQGSNYQKKENLSKTSNLYWFIGIPAALMLLLILLAFFVKKKDRKEENNLRDSCVIKLDSLSEI